jgi:hypothetical protein
MQRKRITRQRSGVIVNNLLPLLLCRIRRETRAPAAFAAKTSTTAKQYKVLKKSGILDYRFGTGLDLLSPAIFIYYPA